MKYISGLLFISIFCASCGQNQTNVPKENINPIAIKPEIKDSITTNVWDIKQDRNGNIWFAASDGVYRYDGKSFTNITGKLISVPIFSILEDRKEIFGSVPMAQVLIITMGNPFKILQLGMGLQITRLCLFMKIKLALFGLALEVE